MTKEVKNEGVQGEQVSEKQLSATEQKAIEQGWRPKDQFDGDEADFIDAPEFVRRGELFQKIEHQSKEVKQLRQALEAFKEHHTKVKETEFNRALKQLQGARKQAIIDGEHERAFALEEKIDEIKEEKETFTTEASSIPTKALQIDPELAQWQANNTWYGKDKAMTAFADALGNDTRSRVLAGEISTQQALDIISKDVRTEFKHKFQSTKIGRPDSVESSSRGGTSNPSNFKLTDDERAIMRKFVATGVISEADYIKDLKAQREV